MMWFSALSLVWKPRSPTAWLFCGKSWQREQPADNSFWAAFCFFSWKAPCFAIGFCLVRFNEWGSSGSLALWRLLRKGGNRFLVFTEMIIFDICFGASLFGEDWRETRCQRRGDWAKQLCELEGGVTIVAVVKSSGAEQVMISVTASLCILVRCPFRGTWFPGVVCGPCWRRLRDCSSGGLL